MLQVLYNGNCCKKIEPIAPINTEKTESITQVNTEKTEPIAPINIEEIEKVKPVFKVVRTRPYTALYAEMGAKRRGQLKKGVTLKVITTAIASDGEEWSKIEFEGRQGYVKSSHLK